MKKLLGLFLVVFLFWSCGNQPAKNDFIEEDKNDTVALLKPDIKELKAPIDAVQENPLTIEDIPKKWYKLDTKKDESGEFVINDYCEMLSERLDIEYDDELGWRILAQHVNDGLWYKLVAFDAYEEVKDGNEIIYGTFILENPYYPDMDTEMYSFTWNKSLKYGVFGGFFQNDTRMVSELNKDSYEWVEENCDYLDEDLER